MHDTLPPLHGLDESAALRSIIQTRSSCGTARSWPSRSQATLRPRA